MDMLKCLKAFVATAECGSFSSAARSLGVAPSVVTKRVNQLEEGLSARLFQRSTRSVVPTEPGLHRLRQAQGILSEVDELVRSFCERSEYEEFLKIKVPSAMGHAFLGDILHDFCMANPRVRMDVTVADGPMDPATSGFDLAFGAFPLSFAAVRDEEICRFERFLCAAPDYLLSRGAPEHPRDLVYHSCLNFSLTGNTWSFETNSGPISIEIRPRFGSNDNMLVLGGALKGAGIALAPSYSAAGNIRNGSLIRVLENFSIPCMWIKATFPERKTSPAVRHLVEFVRDATNPIPPWDRQRSRRETRRT